MSGVRCFVVLSGIPFLHMKLLWEIMPGATGEIFFKLVCKSQGQHRLLHSWLVRDRKAGTVYSPSLSVLKCAVPNVLPFLVVTSGNAQASVASQCEEKWMERKALVLSKRNYKGEQKNAREPSSPLCCTLHMGFCIEYNKLCIQDRHRLVV